MNIFIDSAGCLHVERRCGYITTYIGYLPVVQCAYRYAKLEMFEENIMKYIILWEDIKFTDVRQLG